MRPRSLDIKLGGTELTLTFEAQNMWALSRITGKNPYEFFSRLHDVESEHEAAAVASDPGFLIPLIMAGLANVREYRKLTQEQIERKVCKLFDLESERTGKPLLVVIAELAGEVLQVAIGTLHVAEDVGGSQEDSPLRVEPGESPT